MFSSLRTRLTFSHLAVIGLAMGLSGFLLLSFLESYFLEAVEQSLLAQARITAQALVPGAMVEDWAVESSTANVDLSPAYNAVQQQLSSNLMLQADNVYPPSESPSLSDISLEYLADASLQLSTQLTTRIRILDDQGWVLVDSEKNPADPAPVDLRTDALVARALAGERVSHIEETPGSATMHLTLPAMVDGQLVGVVYLSQPLDDVADVLHDLRTRWLISGVIGLLFSGLVGLLLSRAIARPLRRLTTAAGAVAMGKFDQQVPVNSRDEVGRLSGAFNDMVARLQAARQMQVDFVADVSHELRTPLTAVKGTVETLRDGAVDDPEVRDRFLETVENETDRLIRLVNDLLMLSRADSEALNLRRESVDLVRLARIIVDRMTPRANSQGVVMQVEVGSNTPHAWADTDRIERVLVNLLDNAIKYSRSGGMVTVRVAPSPENPQAILMQVCDAGIGISAQDLPRVGQRFYRSDKARSRTEGGSGLGVAIAQALVKAHGGRLWLESQEGMGTVVSFTLPSP